MNVKKLSYQLILLLFFGLVIQDAIARESIDSLKQAIINEHDMAKKAGLYFDLSLAYKSTSLDESEKLARQALVLVKKTDDKKITGLLHAHLGDIAFLRDSLTKAEKEYEIAVPLLQESGENKRLIHVYIGLGNRFVEKGSFPLAMSYYLKGLSLSEETGETDFLPKLYNNLGVVYINMNEYKKALDYYSKALPLFEELNDTMNVAGATTNIGSIYIHLGEPGIARQYYQKGCKIFKNINHIGGQAHVLFKLGLLDKMQHNFDDALQNLFKSKKLQELNATGSNASKSLFMAETDINIGIVYYFLGESDTAESYLLSGLSVAKSGEQAELISFASENLSRLYKQKGAYKKALEYYTLFKTYSDSSFNEENIRKLTQLEMQYQFDVKLKESEIERIAEAQKRKRLNLIITAISAGLFLVLIIVALLLKLEKKKKKEIELERERLVDKLEHTNKELTTHVMYLLKKNEFILTIVDKLKKARLDAKPENKKVMAELISELQSNTDTISWEEFEVRFQQVHTDFYTKLSNQFPDLTTNEIRLCAFFKLNMTSKEIAALTYQSLNSIKVARYRLRKKLKLETDESLVAFLAKI
ncbi:MAG: tetratricopeptide repeat protein [Bacteroidales bacterium]|nr:tetratricopeptide repeat protein [Bacteroidales bacterium]